MDVIADRSSVKKNSIRKMFFIIAAFAMICAATVIAVDNCEYSNASTTFTVDGIAYETTSATEVKVIKDPNYSGSIDIPSTVVNSGITYLVTSINYNAFSGCKTITSVIIPNSVTSIGHDAFNGCESLCSITISDNIQAIKYSTFYGCSSLTSVNIPDSATYIGIYAFGRCTALTEVTIGKNVSSIEDSVFYGCSKLASIDIPDNVTSIGDDVFYGCSELTAVTLSSNITSINENTFYECSKLASIDIPDNVTSIGTYAFYGCSELTAITFSDNVKKIGAYAFCLCKKLTSIDIPDNITSVGQYAFAGCSGLVSSTIGNGLTSIATGTFGGCLSLTDVRIGNNVTSIGYSAFNNCENLTSITIPSNVTSIGYGAFYYCSKLLSVTIYSKTPGNTSVNFSNIFTGISFKNSDGTKKIDATSEAFPGYTYSGTSQSDLRQTAVAYDISATANDHVTALYDLSTNHLTISGTGKMMDWTESTVPWCSYREKITNVTIGNEVTNIGAYAFYGCTALKSETGYNVSEIGDYAFYQSSIERFESKSDAIIGDYAFYGCPNIETENIIAKTIGEYAFAYAFFNADEEHINAEEIKDLAFFTAGFYKIAVDCVTKIGSSVFASENDFGGPNEVCIGKNFTADIEPDMFLGSKNIWSYSVDPDNPKYSSDAEGILFDKTKSKLIKCPSVIDREYSVPNTVTDISDYAFIDCSGVQMIIICDKVTKIGDCAFIGCEAIIFFHNAAPASLGISVFSPEVKICVPFDCKSDYLRTWSDYSAQIYGSIDVPEPITGIEYNGKEQKGIPEKNGAYTVSGGSYTNAGDYRACVTLSDDCFWMDEVSRSDRTINWSIAKAQIKCLDSEFIAYDGTSRSGTFRLPTGFENEYLIFTYAASSSAADVYSYQYDPAEITSNYYTVTIDNDSYDSGGLADNYVISIDKCHKSNAGTFTVAVAYIDRCDMSISHVALDTAIEDLLPGDRLCILSDNAALSKNKSVTADFFFDLNGHDISLGNVLILDDATMHLTDNGSSKGTITGVDTIKISGTARLYSSYDVSDIADSYVAKTRTVISGEEYGYFGSLDDVLMVASDTHHIDSIEVLSNEDITINGCLDSHSVLNIDSGVEVILDTENFSFNGTLVLETSSKLIVPAETEANVTFAKGSILNMSSDSVLQIPCTLMLQGRAAGNVNIDKCNNIIIGPESSGIYNISSQGNLKISGTIGNGSDENKAVYNIAGDSLIESDLTVSSHSVLDIAGTLNIGPIGSLSNDKDAKITVNRLIIDESNKHALDGITEKIKKMICTVSFISENTVVQCSELAYGSTISAPAHDPVKESTAVYDYSFSHWDGFTEGMTVTEDHTFTAVFKESKRSYTVSFISENTVVQCSELTYGNEISAPAQDPVKESTAVYDYSFSHWDGFTEGMTVTGDHTFTAVFTESKRTYTVIFESDGAMIQYGELTYGKIIYRPIQDPVKESTAEYEYSFSYWDGFTEGMTVTNDHTFTAVFTESKRSYTVSFISENTLMQRSELTYGSDISAPAQDPVKESTVEYDYQFSYWKGFTEGMTVTGDHTFTAVFTETVRSYELTFMNQNEIFCSYAAKYGSVISLPDTVPSKQSDGNCKYIFVSWIGYSEGMRITQDMTFTSSFKAVLDDIDTSGDKVDIDARTVNKAIMTSSTTDSIIEAGKAGKNTDIKMSNGSISLDSASAADLPKGEHVISITEIDRTKISASIAKYIGSRPVYSINIGDVHEFSGKLTISVRYDLMEGERADSICIWYLRDNGSYERLSCTYSEGYATFVTTHLSNYAAMNDISTPVPIQPNTISHEDNGINVGLIVGILVSLSIIAAVLIKKH